jgi:CHAD domain-containing protein
MLTTEQTALLEQIAQTTPLETLRRRARLLLLYGAGEQTRAVAAAVGLSSSQTRRWKHAFLQHGLTIFPALSEAASSPAPAALLPPIGSLNGFEDASAVASAALQTSLSELPYPQPMPAPGVLSGDTLAEAGRKVLLYNFAAMLSHEVGTRQGLDPEELHDMRVATRRMRAAFDVFGPAFGPRQVKRHLKQLRRLGRTLGAARDLDVLVENLRRDLAQLPESAQAGLLPLLNAWEADRQAAHAALHIYLDSESYQTFKRTYNLFLQPAASPAQPADQPPTGPVQHVREHAPVLIYTRLAAVRAYATILPNASLEQLHALRIEFKRLRYTIEYFQEALGPEAKTVINELKKLQDHLGELHDAAVTCELIQTFLEHWEQQQPSLAIPARQSPEGLVTYLAAQYARRHQLMADFPAAWERFNRPEVLQALAASIAGLH